MVQNPLFALSKKKLVLFYYAHICAPKTVFKIIARADDSDGMTLISSPVGARARSVQGGLSALE